MTDKSICYAHSSSFSISKRHLIMYLRLILLIQRSWSLLPTAATPPAPLQVQQLTATLAVIQLLQWTSSPSCSPYVLCKLQALMVRRPFPSQMLSASIGPNRRITEEKTLTICSSMPRNCSTSGYEKAHFQINCCSAQVNCHQHSRKLFFLAVSYARSASCGPIAIAL